MTNQNYLKMSLSETKTLLKRFSPKGKIIAIACCEVSEDKIRINVNAIKPYLGKKEEKKLKIKVALKRIKECQDDTLKSLSKSTIDETANKEYVNIEESLLQLLTDAIDELHSKAISRRWQLLRHIARKKRKTKLVGKSERLNLNWFFLIGLIMVLLIVGYIVYLGWAQKPTVNIEFNVGEIIGGILLGTGALIAGTAYAIKSRNNSGSSGSNSITTDNKRN